MQGLDLPECLSRMTCLSELRFFAQHSISQMRFDFAWSKLVALQHLTVSGSLQSKHALSDLMYLGRLKDVSFHGVGNSDTITKRDIVQLACTMRVERPDVTVPALNIVD